MKRADLEHILRACKGTTGETEFIVIGSQAILGRHPDAPRVLRESIEADVYPKLRPDLSPDLAGNLGELSLFHQTHGIWVDGVEPTTATLPAGWESRLVKVENENTNGAIGWCLDPHDLAYSKLAARREKDIAFVTALIRHKLVKPSKVDGAHRSGGGAPARTAVGGVGDLPRPRGRRRLRGVSERVRRQCFAPPGSRTGNLR
ncbi:MAG: hypothetical protein NTV08_05855 [Verrucomicrobia bacterium]|nr:hypothetical protein [Verrucomicrobiota bacterium]